MGTMSKCDGIRVNSNLKCYFTRRKNKESKCMRFEMIFETIFAHCATPSRIIEIFFIIFLYRASCCNVQMNQQAAPLLTSNLYFSLFCSTCFERTNRSSSGAPSSKLYHAFGTLVQARLTARWLQQLDSPVRMYHRNKQSPMSGGNCY